MKQRALHDEATDTWTQGIDHVWSTWEPSLRRAEGLLRPSPTRNAYEPDSMATQLRRSQYQAHMASEFAAGLTPPFGAHDAHSFMISTFDACRDTLGVLAVRAELEELDDETAEIGLHAVRITREAHRAVCDSSSPMATIIEQESHSMSDWLLPEPTASRGITVLLWSLVAVCVVLLAVLLFEVLVLSPVG